jgi:hypothetical protein
MQALVCNLVVFGGSKKRLNNAWIFFGKMRPARNIAVISCIDR